MLIDSHAHIYDEEFLSEGGAQTIIDGMQGDNLEYIVCVGCDVPTSKTCVELAEANARIYATVGIHPYDASTATPENLSVLREMALNSTKVVAVGEFGLDFHRPDSDRDGQIKAMRAQYELARELCLPQIYHLRDGYGEFAEFAKTREFPQSGVIHCFSSSAEIAEFCVKKGFYVSFSGTVTYNNAVNLKRAALAVPLDRLLIETDSPYLTPEPKRGRKNYPKNVAYVCDTLAQIKGVTREQMEKITNENAKRVFNIE